MKKIKCLRSVLKTSVRDLVITVFIMISATVIGMLFGKLGFTEANIVTVYILGVLLTGMFTNGYLCSVISSLGGVLLFNFFFTEPRLTFHAYEQGYPVTFVIMLTAALITGTLTNKVKKHAEESAQAAIMVQKEQLRANLLRMISHDLRTPLTSISGNANNLIYNYRQIDDEMLKQMFEDIYDDSQWLINLVENLLSVTRIEDGRLNFNMTTEIMDEVVEEALNHINRKANEHSISVIYKDEFLLAHIDAKLIVQVIINIVDNAVKYTPKDSHIDIVVSKVNDMISVSIKDDGPGISDELKTKVFEMFYTGDNKIVDSRRSLGLGLALCKTIVTAHGGTIELTDNSPHGCVFTFTLPMGEVNISE